MKVQVIGVSGLTARRKGTTDAFGASATIAAGGKSSDVHKAEIKVQLNPVPLKQATLTFSASLSGAAAHQGTDVAAVLSCGNSSVTGNSTGTLTLGTIDLTEGTASAELKSSNVTRTCTATIGGKAVTVGMDWDIAGSKDFDYPPYFTVEETDDITFYPTLNTICDDGAVTQHQMFFQTFQLEVVYWAYDYNLGTYLVFPITDIINVPCDGDVEVYFIVNDKINFTQMSKVSSTVRSVCSMRQKRHR